MEKEKAIEMLKKVVDEMNEKYRETTFEIDRENIKGVVNVKTKFGKTFDILVWNDDLYLMDKFSNERKYDFMFDTVNHAFIFQYKSLLTESASDKCVTFGFIGEEVLKRMRNRYSAVTFTKAEDTGDTIVINAYYGNDLIIKHVIFNSQIDYKCCAEQTIEIEANNFSYALEAGWLNQA